MIQFNNKPPKKLVVKNLKNKPKISDEYESTALARISNTIDSVFKDETLPFGHEEIYRSCETLCKFHLATSVYRTLYEKCEKAAVSSAAKLQNELKEVLDEVEYLKKYENNWKAFQKHYNLLESLFLYLDKVYIPQQYKHQQQQNSLINIKRFGLNFFKHYSFITNREMIEKLMILIERIRMERLTKESEIFLLAKSLIEMIRELEEYSQGEIEFENLFIQRTWKFYENESGEEIGKLSIPEYLKYSWNRLGYEGEILSSLLAPNSRDKLIKCVKERLISDRINFIFPNPTGSSVKNLFNSNDMESLKLVYELVNGVFGIDILATQWAAFLRSHGQELMAKGNDYRTIERVAQFKERVDVVIRECFQSDPIMQGTLKDAFETIINGRGERSAELLALYIHQKLETMSASGDAESFLSMALLLFRYLHRKEAFDAFYKRTLAQRLLFHGQKDLNLERQFIAKLREECGGGFVSRMESMLKDVEQSVEMTKKFKSSEQSPTVGISSVTSVTVVSGLWPCPAARGDLTLPSDLIKLEGSFNQFYTAQKKNCSLKWTENLGSCVMRANFNSSRYDLILTIPQALILLKFNTFTSTADPIAFDLLLKEVRMNDALLEESLKSLSTPLYPILIGSKSTGYKINESFEYKGSGKVPLYALQSPFLPAEEELVGLLESGVESPEIRSPTPANAAVSVIIDRQYQVDSLIIRRMKHQIKSNKKDLINYVLANLGNVRVSAGDVEGRLKGLIEKEFIKIGDDEETLIYLP